MYGTSAYI
jgi:D-alanyl-D-alanine carboxypeptidase